MTAFTSGGALLFFAHELPKYLFYLTDLLNIFYFISGGSSLEKGSYVSCMTSTETSQPSNSSVQSREKNSGMSVTDGMPAEWTRQGGPLSATSCSSHDDDGAAQAGCSRWSNGGKRPVENAPAVTSITDSVGVSLCKKMCTSVGSENRQVIVSSSSPGHIDMECAHVQNDDRSVCGNKDHSGDSSYPDNELRSMLSSSGSGSKDQPLPHSSGETCMLQTASGRLGTLGHPKV